MQLHQLKERMLTHRNSHDLLDGPIEEGDENSNSPKDIHQDPNSPSYFRRNYDNTRSKNKLLASVDSDGHILSKSPSHKGSHNGEHKNQLQMLNHHKR